MILVCTYNSTYNYYSLADYDSSLYYSQHSANVVPEEERAHGTISAKTYLKFFKEGVKSHFVTAAVIFFFLSVEVCICLCVHSY